MCIALVCSHGVVEGSRHQISFGRILTEDSSFLKMLKSCAELFPAHGNKHGSSAEIKLIMIFDLLTGDTVELSTHGATTQDRAIACDILGLLRKGDMKLRDIGYFYVRLFDKIEQLKLKAYSSTPNPV